MDVSDVQLVPAPNMDKSRLAVSLFNNEELQK
eukprot:IDg8792t1